jgi:branched-chain amino acid transport system permease protein
MSVTDAPQRIATAFSERTPWQPDAATALLAFGVCVLLLPNLGGFGLASEILILGMFGLSFNILFGFTGLLSFGQALFFGGGAYLAALVILQFGLPVVVLLLLVTIAGGLVAVFVGALALRLTGVYFAMITLAVAQLGYELIFILSDYTGGSQGVGGLFRPSLFGVGVLVFNDPITFYVLAAVIATLVVAALYLITRSPFGRAMRAIKENQERTEALGVNVYRVQIAVFGLSGSIGALSGALWCLYLRFVSPQMLFWSYSGDTMFYTLLGGMNSVVGPIIGAGLLQTIERGLFQTEAGYWNITVGTLFVLVVLFARGGLVGIVGSLQSRGSAESSPNASTTSTEVESDGE